MKSRRFAAPTLLTAALLTACSSPAPESTAGAASATAPAAADAPAVEPMDTAAASAADAQSDTLKTVRARHRFSSPSAPDLFQLVLRGDSLLRSEAMLTITAADGTVIFREALHSADLEASLVYEMTGPGASRAQREAFLRRRMDEFFAAKNFRQPAISPQEKSAPRGVDPVAWNDLRQRPDAVSFQYLVGKEDGRRIAWSPLRKQVVRIGGFGG